MSTTALAGLASDVTVSVSVTENQYDLQLADGAANSAIDEVNNLADKQTVVELTGGTDVTFTTSVISYDYDWSSSIGSSAFGDTVYNAGISFGDEVRNLFEATWEFTNANGSSIVINDDFDEVAWGMLTNKVNTSWNNLQTALNADLNTNQPSATLGDAYTITDGIGSGSTVTLTNYAQPLYTASSPSATMSMAALISSLAGASTSSDLSSVINSNSNFKNILLDSKTNSSEQGDAVSTVDALAAYMTYIHPTLTITYSITGDNVSGTPTKTTTLTDWGQAGNIGTVLNDVYSAYQNKTITHKFVLSDPAGDNTTSTLGDGGTIDQEEGSIARSVSSSNASDSATLTLAVTPVAELSIDNTDISYTIQDAGIDNTDFDFTYNETIPAAGGAGGTFTLTVEGKLVDESKRAVSITGGDSSGSVYLLA
jgi:hypothetical protein